MSLFKGDYSEFMIVIERKGLIYDNRLGYVVVVVVGRRRVVW